MGSKKIIVPQGLINPNETTIIEIPAGVDSEATLIARSSPRCGDQEFARNNGGNPCTSRRITTAPASPRGAAGGSGGGGGQKTVRKVTSTTITTDDDSSFGILSPGGMNTTDHSSFGLMPGAHFENSRNTTTSSFGLMPGAHFDNSRNTTQSSLGLLPGAHFDCSRNTTDSFGLLPGAHFDSGRNTTPNSLGLQSGFDYSRNSPHFDNNRVASPHSLGLSPGAHFDNRNTNQPCSPRGAAGSSGGGAGQRTVRKVTSTTITDDDSSLGMSCPGAMNTTDNSSFGPLPGGHFDHGRNTTQSSLMPGVHFDNSRNTTQSSLGLMDAGYMDLNSNLASPNSPRRRVPRSSPGNAPCNAGNEYYDNARGTDQNNLAGRGPCSDSRGASGNNSPRRVKKIVKKVITESPKTPNEGPSGAPYMNNGPQFHSTVCGASPPPSPPIDSKKHVTTVTSETVIDEGEDSSLGILGPGYFDSTRSSGSLGILGSGYMDSTQDSCESNCPARVRSDDQGSNLTSEVQRHLRELEQTERTQINRDLAMFQQARRQLVQDATNISSSGESQSQPHFSP